MKKNIKRNISLFLFSLSCPFVYSQNVVWLIGQAKNSFTKERIDSVNYTIIKNDSVVVAKGMSNKKKGIFDYQFKVEELGNYKIILQKDGYDQGILSHNIKSFAIGQIPKDIFMRKERVLRAATVTATKIAMVMKGDTIVYDADAFELAEGSMLDALVSRLPGAQLKSGGQIYVNGEKVSKLLVNGRDFFNGDAKVALDNLPSYMVNKIKVFRQERMDAHIVGKSEKNSLPLVMDVRLKKQYSIGWVANAEGGVGTDNRWLGKLFALRFTPNSHLAVYVNANNTSDDAKPGSSADWTPLNIPMTQRKLIKSGIDFNVNKSDLSWQFQNNLEGLINHETQNSQTAGTYFLTGQSSWQRAIQNNYNKRQALQYTGVGMLNKRGIFLAYMLKAAYETQKRHSWTSSADFNVKPTEEETSRFLIDRVYSQSISQKLISDYIDRTQGETKNFDLIFNTNASIALPGEGQSLSPIINATYKNTKNENFSFYKLRQTDGQTLLNRYFDSPSHNLNISGLLDYRIRRDNKRRNFNLIYGVGYKEDAGDRSIYQLHELGNSWQEEENFGNLPSAGDELMNIIDAANSYNSTKRRLSNSLEAKFTQNGIFKRGNGRVGNLILSLKPSIYHDQLDYKRAAIDTTVTHNSFFVIPSIKFSLPKFSFSYKLDEGTLDLLQRLNIYDSSDPLVRKYGNEDLKRTRSHKIESDVSIKNNKHRRMLSFDMEYNLIQNAVAQAFNYDRTTGVRTYRPLNVNGNWNAKLGANYTETFGKKERLVLNVNSNVRYLNSVDYVTTADVAKRSSVRNILQDNKLTLTYRLKGFEVTFKGGTDWNHMESQRDGFSTINAFDYNYGLSAQANLPLGLQLSTDLSVYSRTGYQNHSLNNTDVVWNARLGKTFLKGMLICYVDAFDMLGQLENVRYVLTTQGTTEMRFNVMPRYAMLHLVLRLAKKPKKDGK